MRKTSSPSRLLVIERLLPPGSEPALDAVMKDIEMLVMLGSRERTEAEYRALFEQADFRMVQAIPLQDGLHLLESQPA